MSPDIEKNPSGLQGGMEVLSGFEIDVIGEILNISMGSAATAVSSLLNKKVLITTPNVHVSKVKDVEYATMEPAMCVEITYVTGITGSNIMILRQSDVKLILDQLMGRTPTPDPDFVFDEISISAACEVMNQMMGSSATALSNFLGRSINISTPVANILDSAQIKKNISEDVEEVVVVIQFDLTIEEITQSKFLSIMKMDLAKEIISQSRRFGESDFDIPDEIPELSQSTEELLAKVYDEPMFDAGARPPMTPQPAHNMQQPAQNMQMPPHPQQQGFSYSAAPQPGYGFGQPYPAQPPYGYEQTGVFKQPVDVHGANFQSFSNLGHSSSDGPHTNLDLIMQVPLQVSVEIGKTRKKIKDILEFSQGMVIELEKQAGAPVDIIVNGQLVARGDVVVVEDNFGVRITEILKNTDFLNGIS